MANKEKKQSRGVVSSKLTKDIEYLLTGRVNNKYDLEKNSNTAFNKNFHAANKYITGKSGKVYSTFKINNFVSKKQTAVLKISSYRKTKADIISHLNYISRNGKVPLKDQNGNLINGLFERKELATQWHDYELIKAQARARYLKKELDERSYPRVGASIVLSMPENTNREIFAKAVEDFAQVNFAEKGYEYVMAFHNDTKHPHAHMFLRMRNLETNRKVNPGKKDLRDWRAALNEKMQEYGLDVAEKPSRLKGLMSSFSSIGVHMDTRELYKSMLAQGMKEEDIKQILARKNKSKLTQDLNSKDILTHRQKNLREAVKKALNNDKKLNSIENFTKARIEEREELIRAIGYVAKDIAEDYPNEAKKLVQYAKDLPDPKPEIMKLIENVKTKLTKDSER